ncbi:NAD(P)H dehydrogenase (quinone) [Rhizobium sp. PDO1-076]|uniref:NAD(P)H-dependent oxidoreductase n=1 Tax=Rhizobium sp. PDO1-076 TaxID=1125979 RepID=UPI00024E2BC9|nr:NAD(P)H-dependent oxidoreductase [Rhizobium sp. PDO1-076]EHS49189.1 NAD(P)H dehydrogenase (quinone) [Rhizobium sp. PDO1-076]
MPFLSSSEMPARLLVLNGNPGKATLCRQMAERIAEAARTQGAEVRLVHLCDLSFDANLAEGYHQRVDWEPDLEALAETLIWSNRLVLVQPLWWGSAPGRLKGLFDRLLMPGFAFAYIDGRALPKPLFKGRKARVVISSDTPWFVLRWFYGNGWVKVLKRQILAFVGYGDLKTMYFGPIRGASAEKLRAMVGRSVKILD